MAKGYDKLLWTHNYRKLPRHLAARLSEMSEPAVVAQCMKLVTPTEVTNGDYHHLGVLQMNDITAEGESLIPSTTIGRVSHQNATPREVPDPTAAKVPLMRRGKDGRFHATKRLVRPKRLLAPYMSRLGFKRISPESASGGINVWFQIEEVLDRNAEDFPKQLLRCINLLQESVGKIDLFALNATEADLLRRASENIGWEIVPDASRKAVVETITRKIGARRKNPPKVLQDRLSVLTSLNPVRLRHGNKGFIGYFAAEFPSELIVFENLEADHAMYVVRGSWEPFGRLTRSELRSRFPDAVRIVHSPGWEEKLRELISPAKPSSL